MIAVSKLTYLYPSSVELTFQDFSIPTGQHFLLLGESGSGKTTLLHLLGGLLRNYSGSLLVNKIEVRDLSESQMDAFRGKNIGFVFQKNHLIKSLNVRENLMLSSYLAGFPIVEKEIDRLLDRLGLLHKKKSKIASLSQGQAQRVAIARSVLNKPAIILADEPTSALDDKNCERVIRLMIETAEECNASLIVATHDQRLKSIIPHQINLATSA